jgi:hypothetical protein
VVSERFSNNNNNNTGSDIDYSYREEVWEMIGKEAQELLTTNNSQTH